MSVATPDNTQVVFSVVFNWPVALQEIIQPCKYKQVPLKLIKQHKYEVPLASTLLLNWLVAGQNKILFYGNCFTVLPVHM